MHFVTSTLACKTEMKLMLMLICGCGNVSGIVYSTYRYGTSSVELLAAVQQLAGPQTGLSIVDKAQAVVNTFKVLQTLQTVALLLQVRAAGKARGRRLGAKGRGKERGRKFRVAGSTAVLHADCAGCVQDAAASVILLQVTAG